MKESYGEEIANRTGPELCVGVRKGTYEALVGVRAGRVLSRENHAPANIAGYFGVPTLWR